MRLIIWLVLAALLVTTPVVAQVDTAFKNVEYLTGTSRMQKKTKGTLIVSSIDVRLVDKKGAPYLVIPIADIQSTNDTQVADANASVANKAKKGLLQRSGLGFLSGGGSKQKLILSTKTSTGVEEVIEFQIHEQEAVRQIQARINSEVNIYKMTSRAAGSASADTGVSGAVPTGSTDSAGPPPVAPHLLVTNPFTSAARDSAAAIQVGSAIRAAIQNFMGSGVQVVTQEQMNAALQLYGYPADAVLDSSLAVTLAKTVQASVLVAGTMTKANSGTYTVTARLTVVDGEASTPVTVVQQADESLTDFGRRIAEKLKGP